MQYQVTKIECTGDTADFTLDNGQVVVVEPSFGDEEPYNIGTTGHTGYYLRCKLANDFDEDFPAGSVCHITWDFGDCNYDNYEDYDWLLDSAETVCRIELRG